MTNVRDSVIDFLRRTGMTVMFGNPGSTELPLYRDWPEDFRYVLGLQESAVLSMADGYAQATGNAAIVNLHSAAGLGHAMGALVTAYKNQTPLIVTAGQQARSLLLAEPFLGAIDATLMPKPYVKWACEPARGEDVPKALARAYAIAMSAPRGPVFVSLPVDDWEATCDPVSVLTVHGAPTISEEALQAAAEKIGAGKNPALVVGGELDRCGGWDAAVAFAEKLACPVWAAPMSPRCSFPESHRQFAGFLRADETSVSDALAAHDLVIVAGGPAFTYHFEQPAPGGMKAEILQITNDPNTASYTQEGTAIIGDAGAALAKLVELIDARPAFEGRARPAPAGLNEDVLTSALAVELVQDMRPKDSLVAEEAPSARGEVQKRLRIDQPGSFFATASGGLGFSGSAAVGLALAQPDRRTVALLGDGSSLYTIQALWSAAQEGVPVTYVILSNGGYEALKGIARRWQTPSVGTDLNGLDFVSLAKGFGLPAKRAATAAELRDALGEAFTLPGPSLIDVVVKDD